MKKPKHKDQEDQPTGANGKAQFEQDTDQEAQKETLPSVEQLQEQLAQVEQERQKLYERLQRTMADFQNYQKRVAREREELTQRAQASALEALLPVLDDLDRGIEHAEANSTAEESALLSGFKMVRQRMLDLLRQQGVEPIDSVGRQFDPAYHDAIMEQEAEALPEGTVLQELHRGYLFKGKTLRPARVIVVKAPTKAEQVESEEPQTDNDPQQSEDQGQ